MLICIECLGWTKWMAESRSSGMNIDPSHDDPPVNANHVSKWCKEASDCVARDLSPRHSGMGFSLSVFYSVYPYLRWREAPHSDDVALSFCAFSHIYYLQKCLFTTTAFLTICLLAGSVKPYALTVLAGWPSGSCIQQRHCGRFRNCLLLWLLLLS